MHSNIENRRKLNYFISHKLLKKSLQSIPVTSVRNERKRQDKGNSVKAGLSEATWTIKKMEIDLCVGKWEKISVTVAIIMVDKWLNESKMGWSETRRCVLGVTCTKPMRVPSSSHERIWTWRVDILTLRLQSLLRQMHDHMNLKLQMAHLWPNNRPNSNMIELYILYNIILYNFSNTESSCKFRQRALNTYIMCGPVVTTVGLFNDMRQHINKQFVTSITYIIVIMFIICMCPPVNIHRHGLYYALRV